MRNFSACFLGVLALAAPQAASACAEFEVAGAGLSVTYNPFGSARIERVFTLRIRKQDPAATAVRFIVVDPDAGGGVTRVGQGPEGYDIRSVRDASRTLLYRGAEQPNAANGLLVAFNARPGSVVTEPLRLTIPAGRAVPAGDYFEPLEIRYVCEAADGSTSAPEYQQGNQVSIDLRVPEILSAWVGGIGSRRGRIAFGQLTPGGGPVQRELAVTTQSTVPYSIEVSSEYGRLQRRDGDESGLEYSLRLSNAPVGPGDVVTCAATPAPSGRSHVLQVAVDQDQADRLPAGRYRDIITLSFSPRLGLSGQDGCAAGV